MSLYRPQGQHVSSPYPIENAERQDILVLNGKVEIRLVLGLSRRLRLVDRGKTGWDEVALRWISPIRSNDGRDEFDIVVVDRAGLILICGEM
jgi:hypothetical protein